ncbi:divergent polysaccharide deacetylase family protein [Arcobacter sp. CECT 8985]|uniref:divergent polysaccharide deacetylase family protein n=1 Tax=Arcobacter sp. CECT 8985 TaxID=1935424 RepID=UPI002159EB8A|nr:divergent polysaccharide deacetylase family protein [Arcobacter sp. CECT 8985]
MAKRKTTTNKTKQKKTKTQQKNSKSNNQKLKLINLVLVILILSLVISILSYFFILNEPNKIDTKKHVQKKEHSIKKDVDLNNYANKKLNEYFMDSAKDNNVKYEEYTDEFEKEYVHKNNKEDKKISKSKEQKEDKKQTNNKEVAVFPKKIENNKPKLAIIIDDVTLQRQVKAIKKIGYKITMSFLPPTKHHPDSAKIAQNLPFYIIHFPMQAQSFKFEEEHTLHVGDSFKKIENRVKQLRHWYPNAEYTNNHTGSKFTSNDKSMDYLFKALKEYNFLFVDSRTTAKTVAKKYAKKYDMPYISRNIFLDNKQKFDYIQNQLKKAIRIAKKTGYAIAIGHPHSITLKVLNDSKPLLKNLDLVYVKELPISVKP